MAGDVVGTLALAVTPVAGGLYMWVNRRTPRKACRHGMADAEYCYRFACRFGLLNWLELVMMTAFFAALSVGLAYTTDPEGWLTMGQGLG